MHLGISEQGSLQGRPGRAHGGVDFCVCAVTVFSQFQDVRAEPTVASAPLRWMAAAHLPTKRCICASGTLGSAFPSRDSLMAHSGSLMISQARILLCSPAVSILQIYGDSLKEYNGFS